MTIRLLNAISVTVILIPIITSCALSNKSEPYSSILKRITTGVPYGGKDAQDIRIYSSISDAQARAEYACSLGGQGPVFLLKESDAPLGYKQVVSGLEEKPCIGYVPESSIEQLSD
jgi:hypothetical protein